MFRAAVVVIALLMQPQADAATIILVRHAERAGGMAADVPLNDRGQQRARTLAHMLADAGIQIIYTTELRGPSRLRHRLPRHSTSSLRLCPVATSTDS